MNANIPATINWQNQPAKSFWAVLLTSQLAALIMAVVMMLVFMIFLGKNPLYPVQVIGSTIFGEAAVQSFNVPAIIAGLVVHQGIALVWGLVFAIAAKVLSVETVKQAIILGIVVAIVSMVDSYFIAPPAMKAMHGADIWNREVPIFWNWAAHIVLGASFGFFPKVRRWLISK